MRLKINNRCELSLSDYLESANEKTICHLMDFGIRLNEIQKYQLEEKLAKFSEKTLLIIYELHKNIPSKPFHSALAYVGSIKGYSSLISRIGQDDEDILTNTAYEYSQLDVLAQQLFKVPKENQDQWIEQVLTKKISIDPHQPESVIRRLHLIRFLVTQYRQDKPADRLLLRKVCEIYGIATWNGINPDVQTECLQLINFLIGKNYFNEDTHIFLGIDKLIRRHSAFAPYFKVIQQIPLVAVQHARKEGLYNELDTLLAKHRNDPLVRKYLMTNESMAHDSNFKDKEGLTCFQRAVKPII